MSKINYGRPVEVADIKEVPIAEQLIKARAELAAAKAEVERLKVELNHEKEAKKFRSNLDHETFMTLRADLDRHKRALELALYYVEGDATYEGVKEKVSRILEGEE